MTYAFSIMLAIPVQVSRTFTDSTRSLSLAVAVQGTDEKEKRDNGWRWKLLNRLGN